MYQKFLFFVFPILILLAVTLAFPPVASVHRPVWGADHDVIEIPV